MTDGFPEGAALAAPLLFPGTDMTDHIIRDVAALEALYGEVGEALTIAA